MPGGFSLALAKIIPCQTRTPFPFSLVFIYPAQADRHGF